MSLEKVFNALDHLPTTRIRVLVTIGLITATGVTYLLHSCDIRDPVTQLCVGWEPSLNWLIFLSALAGVDVTQYFAKSMTAVQQAKIQANTVSVTTPSTPSSEISEDGVTSTSDISELNRESELKG